MNIRNIKVGGEISTRNEISLSLRIFLSKHGFVPSAVSAQEMDAEMFVSTTSDDTLTIKIIDDEDVRHSVFVGEGWTDWHGMYALKLEYRMFIYHALISPQDLRDSVGIDRAKEALRRALKGVCEPENNTLRSELVRDGYVLLLHNTKDKVV
jgi:hypothetical protein